MRTRPVLERFWAKVDKTANCWLWIGGQNGKGYGIFQPVSGSSIGAHRFAYGQLVGPIPDGLVLDHLCRVRNCVNPDHLEPVTPAENIRRGSRGVLRTRCASGHEMTVENTRLRVTKEGPIRQCLKCQRSYNREFRRRDAARKRALVALSKEHQARFQELLEEELSRL